MGGHYAISKSTSTVRKVIGQPKRKCRHSRAAKRSGHATSILGLGASVVFWLVGVWSLPSWGMVGTVGTRMEIIGYAICVYIMYMFVFENVLIFC